MSTDLFIKALVMALVVIALRLLPFVVFKANKSHPNIEYLGKALPCAVMGFLIVYCLKDVNFMSLNSVLPAMISTILTALVHAYKKNSLVSILLGTVSYMVLVQFVFI